MNFNGLKTETYLLGRLTDLHEGILLRINVRKSFIKLKLIVVEKLSK